MIKIVLILQEARPQSDNRVDIAFLPLLIADHRLTGNKASESGTMSQ